MTITPTLPTIALLTDFGSRDGYTGVLKGVILGRTQEIGYVPVADISHEIPPQNVWAGAWVLGNSFPLFPPHTIFVAVVDPGVGSADQKPMLLYWAEQRQFFIGPDNGLMTAIIRKAGGELKAWEIANSEHWLTPKPSRTFHGRDIYSPTAGSLATAMAENRLAAFLDTLGPAIEHPVTLDWQPPQQDGQTLHGQVMHVDTYGNVITNIPNGWLPATTQHLSVECGGREYGVTYADCYKQGAPDELLLLQGSGGTLEIARFAPVSKTSAAETLACRAADPLCLTLK